HFLPRHATEKVRHQTPRTFECLGGPVGEGVGAAVDIGVVVAVVVADRLDHRLGFLHGGGVVEVHQRLAVDLLIQNRKRSPHGGNVEITLHPGIHDGCSCTTKASCNTGLTSSPTAARGSASMISPRKAKLSSARAEASSMPRERR